MIVVLRPNLSPDKVDKVIKEVEKLGYEARPIYGKVQTVVAALGDETTHTNLETLTAWPEVETVLRVQKRYKLVSREAKSQDTIIEANGQLIGAGQKFCIMAGP